MYTARPENAKDSLGVSMSVAKQQIYKWHVYPGSNNPSRGDRWERVKVVIYSQPDASAASVASVASACI
jgi:hypothetical protein